MEDIAKKTNELADKNDLKEIDQEILKSMVEQDSLYKEIIGILCQK